MTKKAAPPLDPPLFEADPHEVGYRKPPVAHQFKKGLSGNPCGRPKGARNKRPAPHDERLKEIILSEAYRTIKVKEGDKRISYSMAQAIVRALGVNAARGQLRAAQAFMALLSSTERANKVLHDNYLEAAIRYKFEWECELERRRHSGETGPEPLPHPDDVVIDMRTGVVAVEGPMSKQEKAKWEQKSPPLVTKAAENKSDIASGTAAPDVALAMISMRQLQTDKLGARNYKVDTSAAVSAQLTRKLDISNLSNEQLDALEEALKSTVAQLAASGETDSE